MRKFLVLFMGCLFLPSLISQHININQCYELAKYNYPLIKQYNLIEKSTELNLENTTKIYFPQLSLNANVSWQSDITQFPQPYMSVIEQLGVLSFPGKDRYQFALELYQTLWDGGTFHYQRKLIKARSEIEKKNVEVNLYAINSQINQIYFGILLIREQLVQNDLLYQELQRNYDHIESLAEEGLANQFDLNKIKVELLNREQVKTDMLSMEKTYKMMLSLFTGIELTDSLALEKPLPISPELSTNERPELVLFDAQTEQLEIQKKSLYTKGMPRIGLFATGAYANPGLNMFEKGFKPFFIGGITLSWQFGALYTLNADNKVIEQQKNAIDIQKETFLFHQNQTMLKYLTEIEKMKELIKKDEEIIALREEILKMSAVKVENGTFSINDYLQDILLADVARQNKTLHEIQLLLSMYQFKIESGK